MEKGMGLDSLADIATTGDSLRAPGD